ncbi:ATP-binding cassette sub-family A member 13 [Elgaria multicarinata webbii]|uniref:ATP-binding cassette sub-family A member 13 n=1 Tax=Elgaria multicarinata webbii TaxID=159646 RepID=UPI002FCD68D4
MRHLIHQFKALFWKNWLCRVRQPILSFSEVLWPCMLFLILAVIRFQEPPTQKENCYLEARDLPSRGLYPFAQSLFCNTGSRCRNSSSTTQRNSSFRTSSFQRGQNSIMGMDMTFLKEIQELVQGILETTEKATVLQRLWEEEATLLGPADGSTFLGMNLNETEEMISKVESLHHQPYFWDLLYSLPWLQTGSFPQEHGVEYLSKLLRTIQNSLMFLEELDVMPSNQMFYVALKTGLNATTAALQAWNGEGFQYNLSLSDIVWNPYVVITELESQFGFEKIQIEKILNYTIKLSEIPTKGTLGQFVCSVLATVSGAEADKGGNESCIFSPWPEAKAYLVHSVNQIKLYTKVFQQWISSNRPPKKILTGLEQNIVNLISQHPVMSEIWKQYYKTSNNIIQNWKETPECNSTDGSCKPLDITLFVNKLQVAIQHLFQWPVMKKLTFVDAAVRNVMLQNTYFIKEAFQNLENLVHNTKREEFMHIDTGTVFLGLKQILMNDVPYACKADVTAFEKNFGLPQDSKVRNVLEVFMCHKNHSNVSSKLRERIQLIEESVQLLQSAMQGQPGMPVSINESYLGWQEIGKQLTETSAICYKIKKLLSKTESVESVSFSSCQQQLIQSLIIASVKELLRSEKNWQQFEEMAQVFIPHFVEFIQKFILPHSSVSLSNQDLQFIIKTFLDNTIFNSLDKTEAEESPTNNHVLPELTTGILENFQLLATFFHDPQSDGILELIETLLHESNTKKPHFWRPEHMVKEVAEGLKVLSRMAMPWVLENQRVLNRSLQFFQHFLTDWPESTVLNIDYVHNLSEHFIKVLYEIGLLSPEHAAAAFSTIYTVRNAVSLLVSDITSATDMQDWEKIVSNVYPKIYSVVDNHADLLVQTLSSLYHDVDQFLRMQSNSSLGVLFYQLSRNVSASSLQTDLSKAFELISHTVMLLRELPQKPLCEKLVMLYDYIELQTQSLIQTGKQELETIANTFNNYKATFLSKQRCIESFQYLRQLSGIPTENPLSNGSIDDFYISEITSVNHSNSFLLLLFGPLFNASSLLNETNGPLSIHCTGVWFQMWLKVLEDVSKWLRLDSDFFTELHNALGPFLDGSENIAQEEMCNKTIAVRMQIKSVLHLLKSMTEIADSSDFEAFSHLAAALNHAVGTTSSYSGEELEEVLQIVENTTVELHQVLSEANFSRDFLDSWIDAFTHPTSKLEYKLHSFGKSSSNLLSWKEFQTSFAELRKTTELLKKLSQEQDLQSCTEILQNITKLMSGDDLSPPNISQKWFPALLKSLLTFENAASSIKGCNTWVFLSEAFLEKDSYSQFENAKDILIILTSLSTFNEMNSRLENISDILHMAFSLANFPSLQNVTDAHLRTVCVNLVINYLKLILPTFSEEENKLVDFILTLFNYTGGQINTLIPYLAAHSLYAFDSNQETFLDAFMDSTGFPSFLQHFWPSSVELSREIQTLLRKVSSEHLQNSSFPWHSEFFLKALENLQQYSINLQKGPFPYLFHYFKDALSLSMLNVLNSSFHPVQNATNLDIGRIREALAILKSYNLPNTPGELGEEVFPVHMAALLQNLENTNGDHLIKQLRQISKSLSYILKKASGGQYAAESVVDVVAAWLDSINNASQSWNLTGLRQIMQLLQETEFTEVMQILHIFPEVASFLERIAHKNITDTLTEVYQFALKQNASMAALSKEALSKEVNSLLELLEQATDMSKESAEALRCLTAVICWNITTTTPWSCNLDMQNHSLSIHDMPAGVHEPLDATELLGKSACSDEYYLKKVTFQMACFLHQLEEWHPIILKFSTFHQVNISVLNELLGFWNKLSSYVLTSRGNTNNSNNCILVGKKHKSFPLIEVLSNMTSSEIILVKALFEQLADLYGTQNKDRNTQGLRMETILTSVKNMASGAFGVNNTEDALISFLSAVQPLMMLSTPGNQMYMVLRALLAVARNDSLIDSLETLWLDTERDIESLLLDFNIRHFLSLIDKGIQRLSMAVGPHTLLSLVHVLRSLKNFNETSLKNFEDVLELGRNWLQEFKNKNYSKGIHALVLLMAGKSSPNGIVQSIKDIIYFLEILLNVIYDLTTKEEELHSNDTDLQIMEFIDLFFDDTQYENYRTDITPFQSRTMELIKEFLQIFFPSPTEHYRNKIFFLLKDIHKDIIAEMSVFPRDKILAFLNLSQLDNLSEDVEEVTQNITYSSLGDYIYGLLNEVAVPAGGIFHFDRAKGLNLAREFLNILFRNSAVKEVTRNHEELLAFMNYMLLSANNSWDLIQWPQNRSTTHQFMKQIENFLGILAQNNFPPRLKEIAFANLTELFTSVNTAFLLTNKNNMVAIQKLLQILFWSSRANYTDWPFSEIYYVFKSVFEENDDFGQLGKVIEVVFRFLTLSGKTLKHLFSISEASLSSNALDKPNSLEVAFFALEKAISRAVEERSLMKDVEMLYSNEGQLVGLRKAFLDLISLMIPLNQSNLNGSDVAMTVAKLVGNWSKLRDVLVDEIADFLTSTSNYSIVLEKLVEVVASTTMNSSKEAFSLVQNLLDFVSPINSLIGIMDFNRIFTPNLNQGGKRDVIQETISYLFKMYLQNNMESKSAIRAVSDLLSKVSWKNFMSEKDLDTFLTVIKRQDGIPMVSDIIMELFDLTSNLTRGHLGTLSFLNDPIIQHAIELSILRLLNKTSPLRGLPHFNKNQEEVFIQGLIQTMLRTDLNESIIEGNQDVIANDVLKLIHDFGVPFETLSSSEKYTDHLVFLVKQWLKDQRIYEMCQALHRHLNPEVALLLWKLQAAALNVLTAFSDNTTFIDYLQCAFKSCKYGLTRHFFLFVLEGIHLVRAQYQHTVKAWTASTQGDCEDFVSLKRKLYTTLSEFQIHIQNITESSCECQDASENISKHMQMLTETLEIALSGNPLVALLNNFSLPTDVKLKDFVQNTTELARELSSLTSISDETITIVMESSIAQPKFLSSILAAALAGSCDVETFSPLTKFPVEEKTHAAIEELCSLPPQELYTMTILLLQNLNLRNIIYKAKIPSEVDNLLNTLLDVVSSISFLLNKAQHVFDNLPAFLQTFKSASLLDISSFQSIFQSGQPRSLAANSLQSIITAVCKGESSFFSSTDMFIDMPRITEVLEEDMAKFSIPEDSTPFCLQLYQEILLSPNGALIWTFLKPLLHGKILYTPNTEKINLVIQKANHTFRFVENLKIYSEAWLRMTELVQNSESFLMISQLQDAMQNAFIKNFVESQLNVDVDELVRKLRVYETTIEKMLNNSATEHINRMAWLMVNISSCLLLERFQPVESVEKLEAKAHELMKQNNFLASVIFNTSSPKGDGADFVHELPKHLSYTIRTSVLYSMRTDLIKNPVWKSHPQNLPADGFKYNHIFIPLQDMIERAIISVHTGVDVLDAGVQVQAMPYPCHTSDLFLNNIGFFFPLIMMLTWMVSVASMVRKLVYEREIHLEEYMKTMGVHPGVHFAAWFLENIVVLAISSCALTIILKVSHIFAHSDGFLVFLFFLDFGVSVTMLSYLLSAFFSAANTAALCSSLVYMISFLPYIILLVLQNQLNFAQQTFVCFLSTTAFGHGVFFLTLFEGQEIGIHWRNLYQPLAQGASMTFGWACWMILFDSILYFIAGWYFSNIIPGRLGLRRSWCFPLSLSYWKNVCGIRSKKRTYLSPAMFFFNENFQDMGTDLESDREGEEKGETPVGVMLMSLTKEYSENNKIAVKDLSLAFYKDQITAILGPNGAGKTTVLSMLTGLYPPSSGSIIVNGRDMETELAAIRTEMGVCPQYDVLFDTLSVQEHLLLFGSVKAPFWTKRQLHQQVSRALMDVGLFQHQYKHIGALSGGMKRKLSIAISFIGNSKTVVLDEPTSGVDPCSRRDIWDILLKYRAGHTVIFTTHHLDEAEIVSDRIAILQHGQLRCCGSPSYLKETYSQGHSLTFTKKPSPFSVEDSGATLRITSLVQAYIPQAFLKENSGSELTYMIPTEADKASFKGLFQTLDANLHYLCVTGYGISDTTLEEVFLKLLQSTEKTSYLPVVTDLEFTQANSRESTHRNGNSPMEVSVIHGGRLVLAQIAALLMKRLHHTRRDWRGTLSNILLPVIFVAMAMALFTVKPLAIDYPSLKLTPGLYDNVESFFSSEDDDLPRLLLRYFTDEDDLCMHSSHGMSLFHPWWAAGIVLSTLATCPSSNTSVPYMKNKKGHILYNLSGLNVEEYLIRPSNVTRYGGWSFGRRTPIELHNLKVNMSPHNPLAKVWYSQKGFHSLPSYLNQLNNLLLWKNLPSDFSWKQYGITLHSCPYGGALLDEDKIMENVRQCGVALCIMLGFSILTASIGSSMVKDRVSGAKRLQHITGLGYKTYWFANFLYDMLLYLVPVSLCVGIITVFQLSAFTFRENLAATGLLLILFGYATFPWMYLMSRFFSSSDVAFISYLSLNFVCGLCTMLVTLLPRLLAVISKGKSFQSIYSILKWAFIVFPQFCLGQGLIELAYNQIKFDLTINFGINSYVTPFEMDFLGWIFAEMALQGTLLLLLRVLLHWDLLQKPRGYITSTSVIPSEDTDVEQERKRLFGGKTSNDILLLYNLRKSYWGFSKKNTAVKDISLGIQKGECFGLLGVNGAGKSTTFKMLTGDVTPSAGRAVIRTPTGCEMDISSAGSEGILIGYCPQQDALDDLLTGWEHLYYYCNLRGIPKRFIHKVAGDLVSRLHLDAHADKLVRTYSGGTKRKLSTALALVGKPHILLLDEPSSGMDPCSKRYLWETITKEVQDGCAAVLTSHSMEECEALCTRLAIMVNGSFKCLGSPQHIKNRFGDGYSVKVWLNKEVICQSAIMDCLLFHFPGTLFKGQHLNLLEYHVPQRWGCLAELFKVLERNKTVLQIKHYSISQTTLEQVFINFANQHWEASHSTQGSCANHHGHLPM